MGARITRGMELAAVMYGSNMALALGDKPSHRPQASPDIVPMAKASTVSASVTHRWRYISPSVTNHAQMRWATCHGWPKKKAMFGLREATCQTSSRMTSSRTCQARRE
jgi:hypothetical protein